MGRLLGHNNCCVIQGQCELGIAPVFWSDEPKEENPDGLPAHQLLRRQWK
jgi:hypothetical protein